MNTSSITGNNTLLLTPDQTDKCTGFQTPTGPAEPKLTPTWKKVRRQFQSSPQTLTQLSWELLVCESNSVWRFPTTWPLQNAMVPNGVLVNHTVINQKTMDFLNYVLDHQDSTGWLDPEVGTTKPRYLWGRLVLSLTVFFFLTVSLDTPSSSVPFKWQKSILI